jgi:hypothetical protein
MRKREALIIVFITTVLIAGSIALIAWNKPHTLVEDQKGIAVSATQLLRAYQSNEAQANAQYLNKALEVSGAITGIEHNQDGGSMLLLASGNPDAMVQCTMRDAISSIPGGAKEVRLKGFCTGNNLTGVTLTDCIISTP